jgi:hypothetical protein
MILGGARDLAFMVLGIAASASGVVLLDRALGLVRGF